MARQKPHMRHHRFAGVGRLAVIMILAAFLSSACSTPVTGVPTSTSEALAGVSAATPTPASTATTVAPLATPTLSPVTSVTATPAIPAASERTLLPRSLYTLSNGQIYHIDVHGAAWSQITNEPAPGIADFDVSPIDSALVYTVQLEVSTPQPRTVLVTTDGAGQARRMLIDGMTASTPRWSPDGQWIAFESATGATATNDNGGIMITPATGGEPRLILANDPPPSNPTDYGPRRYFVHSWSPDGTALLLWSIPYTGEAGTFVIMPVAAGERLTLRPPAELGLALFDSAFWSGDGASLLVTFRGAGLGSAIPGLWRADTRSGDIRQVVPAMLDEQPVVVRTAQTVGDELLLLIAQSPALDPALGSLPSHRLIRLADDGQIQPVGPELPGDIWIGDALLAPDGSGVVIERLTEAGSASLVWIPVATGLRLLDLPITADDGTQVVREPASSTNYGPLRWGGT